jgi:putative membrane protein
MVPIVIRLVVRTAILLGANAVGLLVANALLDKMGLNFSGFLIAVVIFTITLALLTPFLANMMRRNQSSSSALGGVSLIAALAALIVTDLISDGLEIDGVGTWLAAAVIVWAASLLAAFILPYLGLKKYLAEN